MEVKKKGIIKKLKTIEVDKTDAFFYIGLVMLGCGVFVKVPWLAFCIVGSVLVVVSIMGALRK